MKSLIPRTGLDIPPPPWLRKMMQPMLDKEPTMTPAQVHYAAALLLDYEAVLRDISDIEEVANGDLGPFYCRMHRDGMEASTWDLRTPLRLVEVIPLLIARRASMHAELTALGVQV